MSTGEGQGPRTAPGPGEREERNRRGDIGVGGGDDSVSRIQLAARWAEAYGKDSDSLTTVLKRFRTAYDYLDAVIHGVDPPELESDTADAQSTAAAPGPTPAYTPPQWSAPTPSAPPESAPPPPWSRPTEPGAAPQPPAPPPTEPRPWG